MDRDRAHLGCGDGSSVRRMWARSIPANVGAAFFGSTVYALSQWLLLVLLARLGGASEVGIFVLALAITTPVFRLVNLDLRQVQASDASERYTLAEYLGVAYLSAPIAAAISLAAGAMLAKSGEEALAAIAAVAGMKAVETIALVLYGYYQREERLDRVSASLVARGGLGAIGFGAVYWLSGSVPASALGMGIIWLMVIYIVDGVGVRRLRGGTNDDWGLTFLRPRFEWRRSWSLAWMALPVGISASVMSLNVQVPRYVIEFELGSSALGVFASLAYGIRVIQLITGAMGNAVVPRLSQLHLSGRRGAFAGVLGKTLAAAVAAGAAGVLGATLVGERALELVYGEGFARGELLVRLMIAGLVMAAAEMLGAAMMGMGLLRSRMVGIITTTAVVSMACLRLVPPQGLMGAADALVVGFGWWLLVSGLIVGVGLYNSGKNELAPAGNEVKEGLENNDLGFGGR